VIKYSSNIAASKIALQLGNDRYYRYIRGFGFGSRTGISLPGEVRGLVRPGKRWRPIDLATTGFGQSIGVTSLQLTTGMACLAKGGEIGQPTIVKEIINGQQGERYEPLHTKPLRRVIQKKTAQLVCDMMASVTQEGGTGVKAAPEGYLAAGKTGTAQVLDPQTRRYATNKYTSIFTGFVPADRPRLVMSVVIHEPHGAIYGGVVAAPVFRNIAARALPYLGVFPNSGSPAPPPGVHMASTTHNKASKTPNPSEKKGSARSPDSPLKDSTAVPKAPTASGVQPKLQFSGKPVTISADIAAMIKPKPKVDLVMNRVQ